MAADFAGYVRRVLADQQSQGVPVSTLWYIDGVTYLSTVIIRHRLTTRGGQIGYQVAQRHRRREHATAMLAATLVYCRETLGVSRVLLTCAESNTASRRVIEANDAVLLTTRSRHRDVDTGDCQPRDCGGDCGHALAALRFRPPDPGDGG